MKLVILFPDINPGQPNYIYLPIIWTYERQLMLAGPPHFYDVGLTDTRQSVGAVDDPAGDEITNNIAMKANKFIQKCVSHVKNLSVSFLLDSTSDIWSTAQGLLTIIKCYKARTLRSSN